MHRENAMRRHELNCQCSRCKHKKREDIEVGNSYDPDNYYGKATLYTCALNLFASATDPDHDYPVGSPPRFPPAMCYAREEIEEETIFADHEVPF